MRINMPVVFSAVMALYPFCSDGAAGTQDSVSGASVAAARDSVPVQSSGDSSKIDTGNFTIYNYDAVQSGYRATSRPVNRQPLQADSRERSVVPDGSRPALRQPPAADTSTPEQARIDAYNDARKYVKGDNWFMIGCLFSCTGLMIAGIIEPDPPINRLLGKSAEYVAVYSETYSTEGKKIQTKKAIGGCFLGGLGYVVFAVLLTISMAP